MKTLTPIHKTARTSRRGFKTTTATRGFTLLELLIAVIIIGILVAIIVPVYTTRADKARHTAALKDLESLASAQTTVSIDTGYFVRLHVLDDTRGGDGLENNTLNDRINGLRDEGIAGSNKVNPGRVFIDVGYDVEEPPQAFTTTANLELTGETYRRAIANETNFGWNGPYINAIKQAGQVAPWVVFTPEIVTYGNPIDPWGNPYLLFNRRGLMDERSANNGGTGQFLTDTDYRIFDRPTIVSLGPNGLPGDGTAGARYGTGDDLMKQF